MKKIKLLYYIKVPVEEKMEVSDEFFEKLFRSNEKDNESLKNLAISLDINANMSFNAEYINESLTVTAELIGGERKIIHYWVDSLGSALVPIFLTIIVNFTSNVKKIKLPTYLTYTLYSGIIYIC